MIVVVRLRKIKTHLEDLSSNYCVIVRPLVFPKRWRLTLKSLGRGKYFTDKKISTPSNHYLYFIFLQSEKNKIISRALGIIKIIIATLNHVSKKLNNYNLTPFSYICKNNASEISNNFLFFFHWFQQIVHYKNMFSCFEIMNTSLFSNYN